MRESASQPPDNGSSTSPDRLDSWKDIAAHLNRGVRTVVRWEREEGLPVHRHVHDKRGSVYAYRSELDAWSQSRALRPGSTESPDAARAVPDKRNFTRNFAALIGSTAILTAALWVVLSQRKPPPVPAIVPLTTYRGAEVNPTFSPDGTRVAFAWNNGITDSFDLYEKQIVSDAKPLRLTSGPARYAAPSWSPDGLRIAFLRGLSERRYGVFIVPALGGAERKLTEIYATGGSPGITWTPDNKWIVTPHRPSEAEPVSLYLVSADTGEMRRLTEPPPMSRGDFEGSFSPDGRLLAVVHSTTPVVAGLYLMQVSNDWRAAGPRSEIDTAMWCCGNIMWSADSHELLFSKRRYGAVTLWRAFPRSGTAPAPLSGAGQLGEGGVAMTRAGDKLAYSDYRSGSSIWRMDLTDDSPAPKPYLSSMEHERLASISPDGKRVAFSSSRSGAVAIWMADHDGSNETQLTSIGSGAAPRWSPDGREIAFDAAIDGNLDVYVVPVSGGRPRRMTAGPAANGSPSWSIDGHSLYFMSNLTNGRRQIWKMPSRGGPAVQVTKNGGWLGLESVDGRFLFFSKTHTDPGEGETVSIWRIPVGGGDEVQVIPSLNDPRNFVVVRDGIYFERDVSRREFHVCFYQFDTGKIDQLARIEKRAFEGLSVSPDRRWLLFSSYDEHGGDLWLVEHFR